MGGQRVGWGGCLLRGVLLFQISSWCCGARPFPTDGAVDSQVHTWKSSGGGEAEGAFASGPGRGAGGHSWEESLFPGASLAAGLGGREHWVEEHALGEAAAPLAAKAWDAEGYLDDAGIAGIASYPDDKQYPLNISGTYKGTWRVNAQNTSLRFPDLQKSQGNIIFQLTSVPTSKPEVHFVHGEIVLRDGMYISDGDVHMRLEGVYVRPFGQLRMVLSSEAGHPRKESSLNGAPKGAQPLALPSKGSPEKRGAFRGQQNILELAKNCKIRMTTQISAVSWDSHNGGQEHAAAEMQGTIESPREEDKGDCFVGLALNATAVNLEAYYNKAINYTLMVTFISFLQVVFLIRQMEHSNTQSGAVKVSLLCIGQQAIMDAYLCLLHLTAGIVVESLFNAFATAAFFKFVIFSIFEMRYLLAVWKARRPVAFGEGWESMRRELSILYSRFYGFLLGGILIMYQLHVVLKYILLLFYCFWIPQIVSNAVKDSRKPLHPQYIIGMTLTRLAIPLYTFGCPKNFMRVEPNHGWCITLVCLMGVQAGILLLQHYFGSRCFIPRQFLPEKYSYFRRITPQITSGGDGEDHNMVDCVICMAPVDLAQRSSQRMVTPCDHFFHTSCLQRWMDIKMECPTCRRALPPL